MILLPLLLLAPGLQLNKGDAWSAKLTVHYVSAEQEIDEAHVESLSASVLSVSPLKIRITRSLVETRMSGYPVPALKGLTPDVYVETLSPLNELLETTRTPLQSSDQRLARLYRVVLPRGELRGGWTATFAGNPGLGVPAASARYRVTGTSGAGSNTVTTVEFHFDEQGIKPAISEDCIATIHNRTGLVRELAANAVNVPMPGGTERVPVKITYSTRA